jgi:hypothetical protein
MEFRMIDNRKPIGWVRAADDTFAPVYSREEFEKWLAAWRARLEEENSVLDRIWRRAQ